MNISKKTLAVSLCAALGAGVCAVPANAAVAVNGVTAAVEGAHGTWDPYLNAELRPGGMGQFTYVNPEAASVVDVHKFTLRSDVTVDGTKVPADWNATPRSATEGGADQVTFTQSFGDLTIVRSYILQGNTVDQQVTVHNTGVSASNVEIDMVNALASNVPLGAQRVANTFLVAPESKGYVTRVRFDGPFVAGAAATDAEALNGRFNGSDPARQAAKWRAYVEPGKTTTASARVQITTQPTAFDGDGDGLRDSWEANGLVLEDGERLDIHRWGASQTRPDIFLQLNWMKSEWETLGCDREADFPATVDGFKEFAACAKANSKDFAPSPETFKELENLFREKGVNLHIDAGDYYVTDDMNSMVKMQGGPTEQYKREFFPGYEASDGTYETALKNDRIVRNVLMPERERLLGPRKAVFRLGVIGDRMSNQTGATGIAPVAVRNPRPEDADWGGVFFVANHEDVTTEEQLRNTILHELGHTLGMSHSGVPGLLNTAPLKSDIVEYESVMSYAHQWDLFNYSEKDLDTGEYQIPSDWENLNYPGATIGKGNIRVAGEDADEPIEQPEENHEEVELPHEADAEELILNAAETGNNDGKAGFVLLKTPNGDNGVVTQQGGKNVLRGKLFNLGSTAETFTVTTDYGTGTDQQTFRLQPTRFATSKQEVTIPLDFARSIDDAVVPVNVVVHNSKGEQVFTEDFNVSALNYSNAQMKDVLAKVLASDEDDELKEFAKRRLIPREETTTTVKPATPPKQPAPQEEGSSASTLSIVIGVLLGLIGLGAAGVGWAHSQGLI